MNNQVLSGNTPLQNVAKPIEGILTYINDEEFYKISNYNEMPPFFMTIVSAFDHWLFISSTGALTAGRRNSNFALFPYVTEEKIHDSADITGSKTIIRVEKDNKQYLWEPFSGKYPFVYDIERNIYKSKFGNKIIFEEKNIDLNLCFRYSWNTTQKFGFVKNSELINLADEQVRIHVLDGLQNIMPYGVNADLQNSVGNLVDAYKRTELHTESGVGIFALSAIIVDRAEPSEALKANAVWSTGLENASYLLSSKQLNKFRLAQNIENEYDIKGDRAAYFVAAEFALESDATKKWATIANVNLDQAQVVSLCNFVANEQNIEKQLQDDIDAGTQTIIKLVASADGLQCTNDKLKNIRHFSNVLFNIMRGGIFDNQYTIEKIDFVAYLENANKAVFSKNEKALNQLKPEFLYSELKKLALQTNDTDFIRLSIEYLPLKFSRRHGDPSRPWNKFSINLQNETDGSKILDYEGNWRDIFQNWEALAHSYPEFIEGMIFKFLNASTFDGYNPYRVTKGGFDWETIEHDNPWSYIGYWGDHQIIYLLKFLEIIENLNPKAIEKYFEGDYFTYANVPYRIKTYNEIYKDPKSTILFDEKLDTKIRKKVVKLGADGALLENRNGEIHRVNFIEKILATVLAKLSNFIPEGGIWLNTQRPEWNDANNALVGNGVSMVTLYYMHRFFTHLAKVVAHTESKQVSISEELAEFFSAISEVLTSNSQVLTGKISDATRKTITDALGQAGSNYRETIYNKGYSGNKSSLNLAAITNFIETALHYFEHSIDANRRADNLFHAYNIMTGTDAGISISYLSEMLEGQVAVLSSGYLTGTDALKVLEALRQSSLYRADQNSYILYPDKDLPRFLEKNIIPKTLFETSELLKKLVTDGNRQLVSQDIEGNYRFNGNFKNAADLKEALNALNSTKYKEIAETETPAILAIFEQVFNHKAFTGRSGTFYGYEGLGSIYWHMVSKLYLAAQEVCVQAIERNETTETVDKLFKQYNEIGAGIGIHKSPKLYGAFSTDAYSHTPKHRGAQQPGMTGQVKEDILVRIRETGTLVKNGKLHFDTRLLKKEEFLKTKTSFEYIDIQYNKKQIALSENSIAFTYCQTPVVYTISNKKQLEIRLRDGSTQAFTNLSLNEVLSRKIFERTAEVEQITVFVPESELR